jgi:hypothetical protein
MDVKIALMCTSFKKNDAIDLSGWIVDTQDGLFFLADHSPDNFNHPERIKISNGNIMYSILRVIPSLGGGWSSLFYRAKANGTLIDNAPLVFNAKKIYIEVERDSGKYIEINVDEDIVNSDAEKYGDYNFNYQRNPAIDWLDRREKQ